MTDKIIMVLGLAHDGKPTAHDGRYLVSCDFAHLAIPGVDGVAFTLETNADPAKAMRFPTTAEALLFFKTDSPNRPIRHDGHPHRPLTHFNVEIMDAPDLAPEEA